MVDGVKDGAAPKAVTTYMEPESLTRLPDRQGHAFMRNWPYAYALNEKAPKVKGKFDVGPLPTFEGGGKAGILGGHNSVISVYSKNPGGALKLIDYIGSPEIQKAYAAKFSLSPVAAATSTTTRRSRRRSRSRRSSATASRRRKAAAGLAGLPADLAGDLQERQRGAVGSAVAGGRGQAGAGRHREGAGDLLDHG